MMKKLILVPILLISMNSHAEPLPVNHSSAEVATIDVSNTKNSDELYENYSNEEKIDFLLKQNKSLDAEVRELRSKIFKVNQRINCIVYRAQGTFGKLRDGCDQIILNFTKSAKDESEIR